MSSAGAAYFSIAVEGQVDEVVVTRLLQEAGAVVGRVFGKRGKPYLRSKVEAYNAAARFSNWVILIDLDRDPDCPPDLCRKWLPAPAPHMHFRVAVRAVEAWLLADRERLALFLGMGTVNLPVDPESILDPKRRIVDLARTSRKPEIRSDLVPRPGSGRAVGPLYTTLMTEFAIRHWRPDVAARHSDSLRRCRNRIGELIAALPGTVAP